MTTAQAWMRSRLANPKMRRGMADFLVVYEANLDAVTAGTIDVLLGQGVTARRPGLAWPSRGELEEQARVSHRLVRLAIVDAQWGPLLERRNLQGRTYAKLGMQFNEWFAVLLSFQTLVTPHLLTAFGADADRLDAALAGMNQYLHLCMVEIARAYFETVDRLASH